MAVNRDFEDLLRALNSVRARYLVAGAYAVIFYTEPRYTKDIDIWVDPTPENARKVYEALKRFGAPVKNLTLRDLTNSRMVYQIGIEPNRIDVLMGIGGVSFEAAWKKKRVSRYGGQRIHLLDRIDLIRSKKEANRLQDKLDLQLLSKASRRKTRR